MQTAVDLLVEKLTPANWTRELMQEHFKDVIQQAKEMERQQIIDAFQEGKDTGWYQSDLDAEEYYIETFKTK